MTQAPPKPLRTLVVDDHPVVRSGLRLLLDAAEGIEVVGEAADADEAVLQATLLEPDVVLMDVTMPGRSGIEATAELRELLPRTRVLLLSLQDDPTYVRHAFAAGARGYVLKEAAGSELVAAIREVAAGGRYVHPHLGAQLAAANARER